jgi:hypothetical protein
MMQATIAEVKRKFLIHEISVLYAFLLMWAIEIFNGRRSGPMRDCVMLSAERVPVS